MFELFQATFFAVVLSVPLTLLLGLVYYFVATGMMSLARMVWGEDHRGYYLLNSAVVALFLTFLLLFSFFARFF